MIKLKDFNELIRIKQPTGALLLILPCLFSIAHIYRVSIAPDISQFVFTTILFIFGAFIMRSAGCIINDLIDKEFDKNVTRTKNRPLASNKISTQVALIILAILLLMALAILTQFNQQTIISGFLAMILVTLYPFTKRITYFPQLFLGLTFNFGIIISSLAITANISVGTIILYLSAITWTLLYDTIYGFQDIEDDLIVGIKSSSIKFSYHKNPKIILHKIALISTLLLIMLGLVEEFSKYYFLLTILNGAFINFKLMQCNIRNPNECLKFFKINNVFGIFTLIAIIIG
jgi:4-hydroxybenzoate polyprenyltransferase